MRTPIDLSLSRLPRARRALAVLLLAVGTAGCDPISLTAASLGAGVGVSHTLNGIIYRTFTAPMKTVENGSVQAMRDMGVKVVSRSTNQEGERVINATARDREIEVLLEPLTKRTTRMRVIASNGLLKDSATAQEIMLQTERVLSKG
ncbi:hypothetical protein Tbd_1946 [Thiobacillus denitrificans ATCC 25259]|uniref:DUF3568 family protein n=1 Tax=Thiobacillus denitrificans (strain ATCC 25259 / T1) TaxID=292415 RepID=Q3SHI7_THIDA|nr:DUF3568 family protein [Thiobacillus denitrificans]AAZ97899.1 hypothetical protein Tbd_1946 [Thiobacillus denitrificans ATCC 25259]